MSRFSILATVGILALQTAGAVVRRFESTTPEYEFFPNTNSGCTLWWNTDDGLTCETALLIADVSETEMLRLNPSVKSCSDWKDYWSYCIQGPPSTTTSTTTSTKPTTTTTPPPTTAPPTTTTAKTTTTTTTTAGNGINTPEPMQPGMVGNCNRFYKVASGETCSTIASKVGITVAQIVSFNKEIGGTACTGIWAGYYICTGVVGMASTTTTTSTKTTTAGNGVSTPTPTQPGMVSNCNKFHKVESGQTCAKVGALNGVTSAKIIEWNKGVGSGCTGLQAGVYACVRTIGYTSATKITCAGSGKTWGDNKAAALSSVPLWCNGDSSKDGSGGFATAQTKYGCYKAPNGENKIEFWARNDFGIGTSLSEAKCNELVKAPVNSCDRGGETTQEGWWIKAVITAGKCS